MDDFDLYDDFEEPDPISDWLDPECEDDLWGMLQDDPIQKPMSFPKPNPANKQSTITDKRRKPHGLASAQKQQAKIRKTGSSTSPQITSEIGKDLQRQLRLKVLDAVRCGHIDVLKRIRTRFAWFRFDFIQSVQITPKKSKKTTPLIYACKYNSKEIIEWLLHSSGKFYEKAVSIPHNLKFSAKEPDPKKVYNSALITAVSNKKVDEEMIKQLLERGNQRLGHVKRHQVTALHIASSRGNVQVVEMLLQYNRAWLAMDKKPPKVLNKQDLKDKNGNTPFMLAVLKNKDSHKRIMRLLLEEEKDNAEEIVKIVSKDFNKKNFNAVMMAALSGHLDCLQIMQEYKAISDDIATVKTTAGWNIIHCAVASGDLETLKWLLRIKRDILLDILDTQTTKGFTPLLLACEYQHKQIVEFLVKLAESVDTVEIDIKAKTKNGLTALHLAAMHNAKEIVDFLLGYEDTDMLAVESEYGNSVLHIATSKCSIDVENRLKQEEDFDKLRSMLNHKGETAEDVRKRVHIPREIESRGEKAKEAYLKALREGTTKNTQCNLIILGEGRVGKTSLIRNILGKDFDPHCKPTQGVQLEHIETVAEQVHIVLPADDEDDKTVAAAWKTKDPVDSADDRFAESVANAIHEADPLEEDDSTEQIEETILIEELLEEVENLMTVLEPHVKLESKPSKPKPKRHRPGPYRPPSEEQQQQQQQQQEERQGMSLEEPSTLSGASQPPRDSPTSDLQQILQQSRHEEPKDAASGRRPRPPVSTSRALESLKFSDTKAIGKKMRHKLSKYKEKFVFHTIDFAGQSLYRPMHHCFITHRAVYIVVFKLTDVLKHIRGVPLDKDPIREIQYWLNNVLAHASISENSDPPKIFLVGTHKNGDLLRDANPFGPLSDFDQNQINEKLIEVFFLSKTTADERYRNTIQFTTKKGGNLVFCVENSSKEDDGIQLLKSRILEIKEKISFLNEDIPTSYIRFEKKLLEMREERQKQPLSTTRKEVENWASECGIAEPEAAIQFYHDIRSIIDQSLVRSPFIRVKDGLDGDLVLLSPQWLGNMMCKIVELHIGNEQFDMSNMILFEKTGVLLQSDLHKCILNESSTDIEQPMAFENLLRVLQSYCLIYLLRDRLSALLNLKKRTEKQFLIPCRIPKAKPETRFQNQCYKFQFCYQSYLPYEVYVHCLLMMLSQAKTDEEYKEKQKIEISDTCAILSYLRIGDANPVVADWKIEVNEKEHSLVFSICPRTDDDYHDRPHRYIVEVDELIVSRVCRAGTLGFLSYKGGPRAKCSCVKEDETVLLPFIKFVPNAEGDNGSPGTPTCLCECEHKEHNVDEILKSQIQPAVSAGGAGPTQLVQNFVNIGQSSTVSADGIVLNAAEPTEPSVPPPQPTAVHSQRRPTPDDTISHALIVKVAEEFHQEGKRLATRYLKMKQQWNDIVKQPHSDDSDQEDIDIDNVQKLLELWVQNENGTRSSLEEALKMIDKQKTKEIFNI